MELNLNGLEPNVLPDILPGTQNDFIKVNDSATGYELTTQNSVPDPIGPKQVLNSTDVNVYDWSYTPKAQAYIADTGASSGFRFDLVDSAITNTTNVTTVRNNGVDRILCTTTGVDLKGAVSVDSLITCPTGASFGVGIAASTTRMSFSTPGILLTVAGTTRVNCTTTGVGITGGLVQTNNIGNTNTTSGTTTHTGKLIIDKGTLAHALEIVQGDILCSSTNTNITSTNGTASLGIVKANTAGTASLAAVRVVDDNTGLYQSTTGNLDLCANGTQALNISSTRIQNQITFLFNKSPAFSHTVYSLAQVNNIQTGTQPLIIAQTPTTGGTTIDFEFSAATNYFGGQEFRIITRAVGAGTIRYRAQSTTYHITGGAAAVTIATNTYHTLVNDRFHILICNVDSNSFYLIQT
ncbi:MAG: hypothetical protein IM318_19425 [Microcystis sp. M017S1]|uniref:hypothetical protein n=1 Tax=Microcystis sp. M017S1 TaxID=2771107 RepID=UPI00258D9CBD|nr:hypothetical protein [Microcystis sp. M017S1]MCA2919744.1 hypothetical protein [Microcystis sp. M017S1]